MLTNEQKELLMHHGIKGQQWGVKNGPPYPLDKAESRRIKAEARLKRQKDKAEEKIRKTMQRHPDLTYEEAARLEQRKQEIKLMGAQILGITLASIARTYMIPIAEAWLGTKSPRSLDIPISSLEVTKVGSAVEILARR